jgi:hypothetical protein
MFLFILESIWKYVCGAIIMHLFMQQQRQINVLRNSIKRLDLELEERDETRADWEDRVDQSMDEVVALLHKLCRLRKRVAKLEKANPEENLDIVHANTEKLRDVLDETRNQLLLMESAMVESNTQFQNEMRSALAGVNRRLDKHCIRSIPDRQLSPDHILLNDGTVLQCDPLYSMLPRDEVSDDDE